MWGAKRKLAVLLKFTCIVWIDVFGYVNSCLCKGMCQHLLAFVICAHSSPFEFACRDPWTERELLLLHSLNTWVEARAEEATCYVCFLFGVIHNTNKEHAFDTDLLCCSCVSVYIILIAGRFGDCKRSCFAGTLFSLQGSNIKAPEATNHGCIIKHYCLIDIVMLFRAAFRWWLCKTFWIDVHRS